MPISIKKAEMVRKKSLVVVIYGFPSSGKTSLALSASKPLLLDFDQGSHRAGNKSGKDMVQVQSWADVSGITTADMVPYDTVVVDTIGTCLDCLSLDILRVDPRCGSGGVLQSFHGFGLLKSRFAGFLNLLRGAGKDVILVAHVKEESKKDQTVERIVASGASRDLVYQSADLMGRIFIQENQRVLTFDPTDTDYGKNCGLKPVALPVPGEGDDDMMARILEGAKNRINRSHEVQETEQDKMERQKAWVDKQPLEVEKLNDIRRVMVEKGAPDVMLEYLLDRAKSGGLVWDADEETFFQETPPGGKPDSDPPAEDMPW